MAPSAGRSAGPWPGSAGAGGGLWRPPAALGEDLGRSADLTPPVLDGTLYTHMQLILLVGGNPLPNYVAARALTTNYRVETVHLLYTPQVDQVKDNLARCLNESGLTCKDTLIYDAGNAINIRSACAEIDGSASYFHYTGGTNAMAVHAHAAWMECSGDVRAVLPICSAQPAD